MTYDDLNATWVAAMHEVNRLRYNTDRVAWAAANEAERVAWDAMQAFNRSERHALSFNDAALVAEVEALRDQVAALTANGVSIHKAAADERAAVVAFLRHAQKYPTPILPMADYLSALIAMIVAGEHHDD